MDSDDFPSDNTSMRFHIATGQNVMYPSKSINRQWKNKKNRIVAEQNSRRDSENFDDTTASAHRDGHYRSADWSDYEK